MGSTTDLRTSVLLSVQRALVGEITPGMRAISVEWSPTRIVVHVYHDGPAAEELAEAFDAGAITQVVADFPYPERGDPAVEVQFHDVAGSTPIRANGEIVFARAGERFAAA